MRKPNLNQTTVKEYTLQETTSYSSLFSSVKLRPPINWQNNKQIESFGKQELKIIPNASSCELYCNSKLLSPQNTFPSSSRLKPRELASHRTLPFIGTVHNVHPYNKNHSPSSTSIEDPEDEKEFLRKTDTSQNSSDSKKSSKTIHQYLMIRLLGKGKFGSVFLAIHKHSGFIGALKVIEKSAIWKTPTEHRDKMIKQMINQIKIQAFCHHPNLIQLYDFFSDQDRIYLFMELGTEGTLFNILEKKGSLQEQTSSVVMREIIQGIQYMHSKRIIHRDIKLQNIVFTCGMAKICDFGWSIYEPKEFRSTICGTPLYLSPEALIGKKYNDKIDIWAIGTICHQMTTGKNPFGIQNYKELSRIVREDFHMRQGSPELKSFITFILRKKPSQRPTGQVLLNHPFITKYKDIETADQICNLTLSSNRMIF